MSASTGSLSAPAVTQAPTRAVALRGDALALAVVGAAFVLLAVLTWNSWGDLTGDTGYDWVAAQRMAHGSLPYADFTYYYGPLPVSLLGAAFAVFGSSTQTAIGLGLAVAAAAIVLTYRVARTLTGPAGSAVAACLAATCAFATGNNSLVDPHSVSASFAVLLSLGALVSGFAYARGAGRGALVATGAIVGLAALTRPETLAALAAATGAWLVVRAVAAQGETRRRAVADLAIWVAVAVAVPLVVYGAFVVGGVSPRRLVFDNLFPTDELSAGGRAVLKLSAPLTASSFVKLAAHLVVYAAGLAVLAGAARALARGGRARTVALALVALAAAACVGALVARPEAVRSHLSPAYDWIPAGAALVALWAAWRARPSRSAGTWAARDQAVFLLASVLAAVAARNYAAFQLQPNAAHAQAAIYALPLAAIFLVWLQGELGGRLGVAAVAALALAGIVLTAKDGRAEHYTLRGPGGTITAPASQGPAYQAALAHILRATRPGEPILLAPQMTSLYTISQRSDPLPEISLLPGALGTPQAQDAAIRRMAGVRVAVTDRRPLTEYGQGAFGTTFDQRIAAWLHARFRHTATLRGVGSGAVTLDLWQRSAP